MKVMLRCSHSTIIRTVEMDALPRVGERMLVNEGQGFGERTVETVRWLELEDGVLVPAVLLGSKFVQWCGPDQDHVKMMRGLVLAETEEDCWSFGQVPWPYSGWRRAVLRVVRPGLVQRTDASYVRYEAWRAKQQASVTA